MRTGTIGAECKIGAVCTTGVCTVLMTGTIGAECTASTGAAFTNGITGAACTACTTGVAWWTTALWLTTEEWLTGAIIPAEAIANTAAKTHWKIHKQL